MSHNVHPLRHMLYLKDGHAWLAQESHWLSACDGSK